MNKTTPTHLFDFFELIEFLLDDLSPCRLHREKLLVARREQFFRSVPPEVVQDVREGGALAMDSIPAYCMCVCVEVHKLRAKAKCFSVSANCIYETNVPI